MSDPHLIDPLLRQLQPNLEQTTVICPLCGSTAYVRGIREKSKQAWEVVFICSKCGLITPFKAKGINLKQVHALHGSHWAAELRGFARFEEAREAAQERMQTPTLSHLFSTFTLCAVVWLLLTGSFAPADLIWGGIVSLSIAFISFRFTTFELPLRGIFSLRRWWVVLRLLGEFGRQIVMQNVTLSIRVLSPKINIKPGIVAIPTKLRGDVALTLLGSLSTLTPDTVMLDIDPKKGMMYVHWIDVKTTDPQEAKKLLSASFEDKIIELFEE